MFFTSKTEPVLAREISIKSTYLKQGGRPDFSELAGTWIHRMWREVGLRRRVQMEIKPESFRIPSVKTGLNTPY